MGKDEPAIGDALRRRLRHRPEAGGRRHHPSRAGRGRAATPVSRPSLTWGSCAG